MSDPESKMVTPLDGKTSIDDKMVFEPERLGYRAADRVAAQIAEAAAKAVPNVAAASVVLAGTDLLADFANLAAMRVVLNGIARDYDAVKQAASALSHLTAPATHSIGVKSTGVDFAVGAITPVTAGIQAALGLVSLFREDVGYQGTKTSIDPLAFQLALAAHLKDKGVSRVIVPALAVISDPPSGEGSLTQAIGSVQAARIAAWSGVAPFVSMLVKLDVDLARAIATKDQNAVDAATTKISSLRKDLDPVTEMLNQTDKRFDGVQTDWEKVDPSSGLTQLARLIRAEALRGLNATYVHAAVVSSGGHHRTSRSLFRMMFLGDGLRAMGGVVVRWAVLDGTGGVTAGGILDARESAAFPGSVFAEPDPSFGP